MGRPLPQPAGPRRGAGCQVHGGNTTPPLFHDPFCPGCLCSLWPWAHSWNLVVIPEPALLTRHSWSRQKPVLSVRSMNRPQALT